MNPQHLLMSQMLGISREHQPAMLQMRDFYRQTGVFSKAELDRLRFLRWLYQTGRLAS